MKKTKKRTEIIMAIVLGVAAFTSLFFIIYANNQTAKVTELEIALEEEMAAREDLKMQIEHCQAEALRQATMATIHRNELEMLRSKINQNN
ncbi:MAG: hypothetical protein JXQ90_15630 [Cyclobacteriaceae bacterium]